MLPALIPLIGPALNKILDLIPDKSKREEARMKYEADIRASEADILKTLSAADTAQIEVNKAEASNLNLFVSGWRPFIGWVCGSALAYHYIIQPFLDILLKAAGKAIALPNLAIGELMPLITAMLGMGAYRMMEKKWGVASK